MFSKSLRIRVALGIAMLAIAVVTAHSIAIYSVADEQEEELIDQIVTEELNHFIDVYRRNPKTAPILGEYLTVYVVRNDAERSALPSALQGMAVGLHELLTDDGGEQHVGVRRVGAVTFYLTYDVSRHEVRMREFAILLVLAVIAAGLFSLSVGYWLSGMLIQPVSDLAEKVDRLGPLRPEAKLEINYADIEIRQLARAFDRYAEKVAELVEREQAFTADVSHELRTPLTSIATGCELLLQEPQLSDAVRQRVLSIQRAARRLSEIVQSMLFLARGETGLMEPVAVRECIEEAVEPLRAMASESIAITIDASPTATVNANRTALTLVVSNLVRNALEHTERGFVRVSSSGDNIVVEDSGHGIAPQDLPHIFKRHYRGAAPVPHGAGLGLAIVKRVCDRHAWRIEVESSAAGTRIVVSFPPSSQNPHNDLTHS